MQHARALGTETIRGGWAKVGALKAWDKEFQAAALLQHAQKGLFYNDVIEDTPSGQEKEDSSLDENSSLLPDGAPPRPVFRRKGARVLYVETHRLDVKQLQKFKTLQEADVYCNEAWNLLTEIEKKPYEQAAVDNKKAYVAAVLLWKKEVSLLRAEEDAKLLGEKDTDAAGGGGKDDDDDDDDADDDDDDNASESDDDDVESHDANDNDETDDDEVDLTKRSETHKETGLSYTPIEYAAMGIQENSPTTLAFLAGKTIMCRTDSGGSLLWESVIVKRVEKEAFIGGTITYNFNVFSHFEGIVSREALDGELPEDAEGGRGQRTKTLSM